MRVAAARSKDLKAGAILAAAGAITAASLAPVAPQLSGAAAVEKAMRLVSGESILNIPFNLVQDIVNIPSTEVQAVNTMADSLLFTGNWWTPSATNLWGEDPGDPGHFMGIIDMLIPFKEISGLGQPEIDPVADANGTAGLGQQLALLAAAELPASAGCDATSCPPVMPTEPITGITGIDRSIEFLETLANTKDFPLFNGWFKVPLQDLANGYTFGQVVDPSDGVGPNGSVPDGFGLPGTQSVDGENLMPWAGIDFKLNLLGPFENFYNSLLQTPDMNGFDLVGPEQIGRAMQSLLAGLVADFNPFAAGSPECPASCVDLLNDTHLTTKDIIASIGKMWPGNTTIDEYLDLADKGLANGPTAGEVATAAADMQTGTFTLSGEQTKEIDAFLATINPYLPNIVTNSGLLTDPAYASWDGVAPAPESTYGGYDSGLLWNDYLMALDPSGGLDSSLTTLWSDMSDAWNGAFDWL